MRWLFLLAALGLATPVWGARAHGAHGVAEEITQLSGTVPALGLTDQFGRPLQSEAVLKDPGRTVVVTFTYTRCRTLCPVVVPMAIDLVAGLRRDGVPARLVVFTVDPAHDGPAEMAAHAEALAAGKEDLFVTGDIAKMRRLLRYFGLTSDDPESHPPLILSRARGDTGFTRMIAGDRTTPERLGAVIRGQER